MADAKEVAKLQAALKKADEVSKHAEKKLAAADTDLEADTDAYLKEKRLLKRKALLKTLDDQLAKVDAALADAVKAEKKKEEAEDDLNKAMNK